MELNERYHIRFAILSGSRIFVFGRFLSNGIWWYPWWDKNFFMRGKGWVRIGRFGITWHGLYGN